MKKNTKLESFLKKSLPLATYEKIRGYESCVVVSENDNKTFKYVIVGSEHLYLTENPPKVVQHVVSLGDVTSVEAVNDLPDFLSGEEKRNSQHISISYRTSAPPKQRSLRHLRKSHLHGSASDITERSNQSTPRGSYQNLAEDTIAGNLSIHSFPINNSNQNNSMSSIKDGLLNNKKKFSADISDENVLKSLKEELEDGKVTSDDEDMQESRTCKQLYTSYDTNRKFLNTSGNNSSRLQNPASVVIREPYQNRELPELPVTTDCGKTPISFTPNSHTITEKPQESFWDHICCTCWRVQSKSSLSSFSNMTRRNSVAPEYPTPLPNIALSPTADVQVTVNASGKNTSHSMVSGILTPRYFNHNSPIPSTPTSSRPPSIISRYNPLSDSRSTLVAPSLPDLTACNGDLSFWTMDKRDAVIDIYLLNLTSPMLMLIRSAWCNALLRATNNLQKDSIIQVTSATPSEDRVDFEKLMQDMMCEQHDLATLYSLCDQFKIASKDNMAAKKSFFTNGEIFLYLVRQLQTYTTKSSCDLSTLSGLDTRADELELLIVITDLISTVFSETEIFPFREHNLKADRGKCVLDLFIVLMSHIEVPDASRDMGDDQLEHIDELNKLLCTFTKSAVSCIYELLLMAKQAHWNHRDENFFSLTWMIKVLEELKITERFIEHLVSDVLRIIMPTRTPELSPKDTVYFYKQLFVALTFLEESRKITATIRTTYREEFKYFIHAATVTRKVPIRHSITFLIVRLIDRIKTIVLTPTTTAIKSTNR